MTYAGCRPVLLVEGDGDREAVPFLIRRVFPAIGAPECYPAPRPIMCGDIPKLRRVGELEKFVEYACVRSDGDSVLLIVDCDDDCPKDVAAEFGPRIRPIAERYGKKVGLGFMYREFETLFLYSLRELATAFPAYDWKIDDIDLDRDWTGLRDAKGALNDVMASYYYKETRDQVRFVTRLDLASLEERSRSAKHLRRLLDWLRDPGTETLIYPVIDKEID